MAANTRPQIKRIEISDAQYAAMLRGEDVVLVPSPGPNRLITVRRIEGRVVEYDVRRISGSPAE